MLCYSPRCDSDTESADKAPSQGFGFVLDDDADELGNVEGKSAVRWVLLDMQTPSIPAVFVHYTAIANVKSGPNGFRSLLEVSVPSSSSRVNRHVYSMKLTRLMRQGEPVRRPLHGVARGHS